MHKNALKWTKIFFKRAWIIFKALYNINIGQRKSKSEKRNEDEIETKAEMTITERIK